MLEKIEESVRLVPTIIFSTSKPSSGLLLSLRGVNLILTLISSTNPIKECAATLQPFDVFPHQSLVASLYQLARPVEAVPSLFQVVSPSIGVSTQPSSQLFLVL